MTDATEEFVGWTEKDLAADVDLETVALGTGCAKRFSERVDVCAEKGETVGRGERETDLLIDSIKLE